MARTIQQIIQNAKAKQFDERVKNIKGSYRFDIEGAGSYRLEVDHGQVTVREGDGAADCVIICSVEDFVRVVEGQQNLLTAYMQGRVRFDGDIALAKVFHGILPGPHAESQEVRP
jgi:putative sterol carrier protein